ncbi:MAG: hypothetical protein AVDCRST_MAG42-1803 [uncultured Chthoniobacterales bacterium]|uniref:DUF3558 domain-containing protein n=1 Tax=uncultured Chthoniobacterales bacterium TaxID=1836801 RepID=A0A6J4HYX0_9BACT|nr:MAG: hypothetical protein AVDCRST_MAG42-1803 [uncultured Chthoniobacterales bacterium]
MCLFRSGKLRRASAALALAGSSLLLSLVGCSKSDERAQTSPPQSPSPAAERVAVAPAAPIDPCSLLTSEEITAVQGEALVGTKPSVNQGQGLAMYDCFYTLPTFTNSISLSVTQSGSGLDARNPSQSWQETFGEAARQNAKKSGPPQKVEGIGDEAFWAGDNRMGALYVLKGSRFIRISVGGAGDQAAKIEKCRSLAEAALKHL